MEYDGTINISSNNQTNKLPEDLAEKYVVGKFEENERVILLKDTLLTEKSSGKMKTGSHGRIYSCYHDPVLEENELQQGELKCCVIFDVPVGNADEDIGSGSGFYILVICESYLDYITDRTVEGGPGELRKYIEPTIIYT